MHCCVASHARELLSIYAALARKTVLVVSVAVAVAVVVAVVVVVVAKTFAGDEGSSRGFRLARSSRKTSGKDRGAAQ